MMNKKKLFGYVMTGALSIGIIGGAGIPAFAATDNTNSTTTSEQTVKGKWEQSLDEATKQKVQAIMDQAKAQLAELGVEFPTKGDKESRGNLFANLDDATKEKAQAIMEKVKDGSLTREEAQTQLADLGVELPAKGPRGDLFANLDDATKEKAQAIMEKVKGGSLTHEEAQTQLADLGVELPAKGDKGPREDLFADLDDATKEKAQAIMEKVKDGSLTREEAQTQLADLGVELPAKGDKGPREDLFAGLDDATKEKAQAIMDDMNAQLTELGVDFPAKFKKDSTEAAE
ncbi:polyhydroxyalkanoate synthesis regulator phasin [Bacillus fengqiuensis]|nr:polyhydroxyalkanoate synthesis regulator phasin [Bacillus fengqiuensis]